MPANWQLQFQPKYKMVELLIEIYSEEIPARMQQKAADCFKKIFSEFLNKQSIHFLE